MSEYQTSILITAIVDWLLDQAVEVEASDGYRDD